ncbi:hypothetical protein AOL_s00210g379 [Orbilia oligospora ATCC 24927]|uniref:Uncharacterized protein n=1 Tax=Arthrobotrys oligospora (strain ATCC 24927 / CBS 115.81 / DSM 1491) TaxID=756982 RepID=G1XSM0_ARTOA|nr:hypothetical protein AOL_s00210g379 [Orbilia oligospora ATCC 24927]EGX43932.1 hypothetical protein AOL_s00210g379 [Orbilia oligospora ATCC 24927]
MSIAPLIPVSSRSTVGDDFISKTGSVSFLFDYTLDFGLERTIVISRLREPSEIPRPADYMELLPVAYYLSVDPRFRSVLLTPTYETIAAVSFVSFPKPTLEFQEPSDILSSRNPGFGTTRKFSGKSKGHKIRFSGDRGATITWERRVDEDVFDLWVSDGLVESSSPAPRSQTRRVGNMRRTSTLDSKRIVLEANTRYIGEVAMLASALAVLKRDALEEKRRKKPTKTRRVSLPFVSASA